MLKRVLIFLGLGVAALSFLGLAFWYAPLLNSAPVKVEIQSGQTLTALAEQWQQEGWLPSALLLRVQARVYGNQLKVGEYEIPYDMNSAELLPFLAKATPLHHRLTLVEGHTLSSALSSLANHPMLEQDVQPLTLESVAQLLNIEGSPEGWIYPDTYIFHKNEKVSAILKRAYARMQQQLEQAWENRTDNLPYKTPYDALIMASIVEKETGLASERPRIAGVFVRRLQKRMRLETDPTIIYGLGDAYTGKLRRAHLRDASNRWNTYRHFGLPPTPIALLGREALDAALNPAAGDELFFVARGDGSHQFSATLAQHNQAVRKYQLNRKADYRSTPTVIPPKGNTP